MRSRNDAGLIGETLRIVYGQTIKEFELINVDNASSDGTPEIIKRYNNAGKIINIKNGDYVPGKVLNAAVEIAAGDIIVFLNSDATPCDERWLENLVAGLEPATGAVAVYGRQIARRDANLLIKTDYARAYRSEGKKSELNEMMFSFASAAFYRHIWKNHRFYEGGLSEDMEWCARITEAGYKCAYIPGSAVYHSHNYGVKSLFEKTYRENIPLGTLSRSGFVVLFKRFFMAILRDVAYCLKGLDLCALLYSPVYRLTIFSASYFGRKRGMSMHVK